MLLRVTSLAKSWPGENGPVTVLDGVSFTLDAGRTLALTGESGSGKSTLLHLVAGLDDADSGRVEIDGKPITELPDPGRAALRRQSIGLVFQQFNLIPSLDVGANLAFQARLAGRDDRGWTETLIERLGLAEHRRKYPEQLSGGQQQRVAVGRALALRPRLVLADEPTGNLDEATGDAVMDLMLELVRETRAALLLVTHSDRLAAHAEERLRLRHGRLEVPAHPEAR